MEIFYFSKPVYQIVSKCLQNGQREASTRIYQQMSQKNPMLWKQKKVRKEKGRIPCAHFSQGFVLPLPQTYFRAGQAG